MTCLPAGLGSHPLSVMPVQPPMSNRLPLPQDLQGPAQTTAKRLSSSRGLLSFLLPGPPAPHRTWVLLPAMMPMVFFSFCSLMIQKPLPGGNSSPAMPAFSWDILILPAAVHRHVAPSRPWNFRTGGKVTFVASLAGQRTLQAPAWLAWPKISQAASAAMKCRLFIAADYC